MFMSAFTCARAGCRDSLRITATRVRCSQEFVRRYERECEEFLDRIVTTEETLRVDPETKAKSCIWKTPGVSSPKEGKSTEKRWETRDHVFHGQEGHDPTAQVTDGQTVTDSYYAKVLSRDVMHVLHTKRPNRDPERIIFHQDNTPGHRANSTVLEINLLVFEILLPPFRTYNYPFRYS
ncbi:LOW QUALITY PROTEIN: hypothetical protein MAR_007520 [Mya arenaria]|uniref:Transposase n=1 Tax=Mya arenaria TaxID=6604 RepID=A0ABY7DCL5_MYAAR|nr:LOW QUALITY PROTEIN: hypothetical protein MAR_007520 [Mya arenaria]